jgi:tryptophan aminotransferase
MRTVLIFSAGKPNPTTFPFESITLNLKPPLGEKVDGEQTTPTSITIEGPDLEVALQYGPTSGLIKFRAWLEDFQSTVHKREKNGEWAVNVGTGSQDLMVKVCTWTIPVMRDQDFAVVADLQTFGVVLNRGDSVLLETPVYAGVLPPLRNLDAKTVGQS